MTEFFVSIFGTKFATGVNKTDKVWKIYTISIIDIILSFDAPKQDAYDAGEWFKFRIHYGFVNAGYNARGQRVDNKKTCCWKYTTGMSRFFFVTTWKLYRQESGIRGMEDQWGGYVKTKKDF
jgi:hypothetical protein